MHNTKPRQICHCKLASGKVSRRDVQNALELAENKTGLQVSKKKLENTCSQRLWKNKLQSRRWHVTISCQPDGRPPQPVRPWKSGRVHLAECSNVVVLELPYSTKFGRGRAAI